MNRPVICRASSGPETSRAGPSPDAVRVQCARAHLVLDGARDTDRSTLGQPVPVAAVDSGEEHDLRETGRVEAAVREALAGKPERHYLELGTVSGSGGLAALSEVGG